MEADEEKVFLGCSSFFTEDSSLLSNYLQRQAERAGSRLFNCDNPLLFLRSRIFQPELGQTKAKSIIDRCACPPVSESMAISLSLAREGSSESFMDKKCSSNRLSELEQERKDSFLLQSTPTSSDSYVESSEICEPESAAEKITTRLDESLQNNSMCCKSKQVVFLSNNEEEVEGGAADVSHKAELHDTDALNLLVMAAMQEKGDPAVLDPIARGNSLGEFQHGASPVYGSYPCQVLKKRVIRRAKSAFQKQFPDDFRLARLRFCESVTRPLERKGMYAVENRMKDLGNAPERRKGRVVHAKRRKLQDLPLSPMVASVEECTDVDKSLEPCLEGKYAADKHQSFEYPNSANCELAEVGKESLLKGGNPQASVAELSSSYLAENSKIARGQNKYNGTFIDDRKLQIASSRFLNACIAEHSKGAHIRDRQLSIHADPDLPLNKDCSRFGIFDRVSKGTELKRKPLIERHEEAEFSVASLDDLKHGSPILRLKILPIRLPSADLPLLEDVSTMTGSEILSESRMMTRKRRALQMEADKRTSTMEVTSLVQHAANQMTIHMDPAARTKRGRSQVLPTKFSDSVLQPWKSSRRNTRVLNA